MVSEKHPEIALTYYEKTFKEMERVENSTLLCMLRASYSVFYGPDGENEKAEGYAAFLR